MLSSETEIALIASAKRKVQMAQKVRLAVIALVVLGTGLTISGLWVNEFAIYMAFGLVVFAVALPQFGQGPKYEELVSLLEKKNQG
ncbi:hypothetical protein G3488_05990 [Shewanella baltica]|uniref:hypothetical protein n=1 Tax=Shewanella baltica TaxID=62322 RepID=UPI00217D8ECF|nr:hypothetical protein [Shewanella baltica]MCS6230410.1 hypothetical protein [Shewanella baltica]